MQTYGAALGFITERPLTDTMIGTRIVLLLILPSLSLCAPQVHVSDDVPAPQLANPFGSSEENRRLLQSYIKSSVKDGQNSPELNTREQEVFFLFSLHDYDRSGQMDGLELMQLLTDFMTHEMMPNSTDSVISLVDDLLQTHDLNQDGLLAPSELLSISSMTSQQQGNSIVPHPPGEEALKQEQTQSEDGDSETHQQGLVSEHGNETKDPGEEPADHGQISEKAEEWQERLQPPEQLHDDQQKQEQNMPVHQEQ